ncbi:MAG: virulence protein [[Eubacterium] siraeum]
MTIYYNVQDRIPLVKAISEFTGADAVYMRTPTYAYQIDYFTVTREGNLEFDDRADSEEIEGLLEFLAERGFIAEVADTSATEQPETASEEVSATAVSAEHSEPVGLTVEVPLESTAVENLTKLLKAKGRLIRKALAVDKLPIEVTDSTVKFPWFAECSTDECKAYTHFISALCELAANAKRVTAKEKETDNDKYAFRCFLLRLGFIGSEYKAERKILLRNLTGSSAFRNGGAVNEVSE